MQNDRAALPIGSVSLDRLRSSVSDLIAPNEIAYRLELTPRELKITYIALKTYLNDFGHDEVDLQRLVRDVLEKLPEPASIETIDLALPRGRPRL